MLKIKPPNTILLDMAALFLTWPGYKVIVLMAYKLYIYFLKIKKQSRI